MTNISRRRFLQRSATAAAVFTIAPSSILGRRHGYIAQSDKINIAVVGIGGMGNVNLNAVKGPEVNIFALCDVDWKYAAKVFEENPNAKKYWDYRKMLDEGKYIDGVIIATPDHTHAIIAADALAAGKDVYVQQPLAHSIYESRLLTKSAAYYNRVTQMGNQGSSAPGVGQVCDWIWNGEIGEVTRVDAFTNRTIWPHGLTTPAKVMPVPDTLNWDLFTGPAPMRPFNDIYHPWNWRGWWNYGTGALGDMACHIMHPIFKALQLGYPSRVKGSSTPLLVDCVPGAQHVRYIFPQRAVPDTKKVKFPEVEVNWYDGGIKPAMPKGWPAGKNMDDSGGAAIFYGTKDTLVCGCYGNNPWLLSRRTPNAPKTQREVQNAMNGGHEMDWLHCIKSRNKTTSNFAESGPFTEMVLLGVLAVRLQSLHKDLEWDGPNMKFTNIGDNEQVSMIEAGNFGVDDGVPKFDAPIKKFNAKSFAEELIKHKYREGWSLPAMP